MPRRVFTAIGLAMMVNIFLFALLPNFLRNDLRKNDLEIIIPVHLIQMNPAKAPLQKKEEKLPELKPLVTVIHSVGLRPKIPNKQDIQMELPRLSFQINSKLARGIPVAPPAEGPTVFPFKDFYDQNEVDKLPMAIFKLKPFYPYRARRLNITGKVDVKFLVDEEGYVSNISILNSTPPGIFDDSVLKALSSWRFSPGEKNGYAVATWVITTIEFKMESA